MNTVDEILPDLKLRFHIEHPNYEDCYAYGYACALASIEVGENPYEGKDQLAEQWEEGWWDGFYGQEPLFELDWLTTAHASNDQIYSQYAFLVTLLKVTGAVAATALVAYQLFEWVA